MQRSFFATRAELDLTKADDTARWVKQHKPDVVFHAAAKVGGIAYNNAYPVDFLAGDSRDCAQCSIRAAHEADVSKLAIPRLCPAFTRALRRSRCAKTCCSPDRSNRLTSGTRSPRSPDWKLVEAYRRQHHADFISVMPTNLYGKGDNYHPEHSHVPAALIQRFLHEAKISGTPTVTVWGTGKPRREFMSVDDLADACVFVLKHYSADEFINIGTGQDITIGEFATLIAEVVGYKGKLVFDTSSTGRRTAEAARRIEAHGIGMEGADRLAPGTCLTLTPIFLRPAGGGSKVSLLLPN